MLNKWKIFAIPALILMIVISPYYVKAQAGVIDDESTIKRTGFVITATSTTPTFRLEIKDNNDDWSQFDTMMIDWKIENIVFPTSSIAYFEIIGDSPSSTDAVIYPVSNITIAETKSPLEWALPDDISTGEYHLSAYIYTFSSEPVLTSNSVGFYVERQEINPHPTISNNNSTGGQTSSGQVNVINSYDNNSFLVNKSRIESLKNSITDLEKYLKELKDQLNQLNGSKDIEIMEIASTSEQLLTLNKLPVGWSEDYLKMTDSDKDELPDEIELIIGSDPNKTDSDDDGYVDGTEVKNSYNPLLTTKTKVSLESSTNFEGKIVSTSNEQGQKSNWLIKNNQKIYLNMPAT